MENRALRGKWETFRGVLLKGDGCMDSAFTDFHVDSPRDCFISEPQRGALEEGEKSTRDSVLMETAHWDNVR